MPRGRRPLGIGNIALLDQDLRFCWTSTFQRSDHLVDDVVRTLESGAGKVLPSLSLQELLHASQEGGQLLSLQGPRHLEVFDTLSDSIQYLIFAKK